MTGADFFEAMSNVLIGFEELNQSLLTGISSELNVVSYIEDIETGSIRLWLKDQLKGLSDDDIRDLSSSVPTLPFWLIKAKNFLIETTNHKDSDEEKVEKIVNGVNGLLDDIEQTDAQEDWLQKEKWDRNATFRAIKKITQSSQKLDEVIYIDNDKQEHKIVGTFNYEESGESTETENEIRAQVELLSMHKITERATQKKWCFRYGGQRIDVDISECADFLSNKKFKARGCFMEVVLIVKQSEINKNGMRDYSNDYVLKEVIEIEQ